MLELVERQTQFVNLAAGKLGVIFQGPRQTIGFRSHLALEVGYLRAQLLDARMLVKECRGLLGELRAQRDALFG